MFASMYAADGVGLAAPQIGVSLNVFVYDCLDAEDRRHVGHIVNPEVVSTSGPIDDGEERLPIGAGTLPRAGAALGRNPARGQ